MVRQNGNAIRGLRLFADNTVNWPCRDDLASQSIQRRLPERAPFLRFRDDADEYK
jgi:hypothetical protein